MIKWLTVLDVGLACELITQPRVLLRRTEAFVIILMISKPTAVSIVVALTTCSLHRRFSLGTGARVGRINWHGNERGRNPLCKDDDGGRRSDRHEVNLHKARHTVGVSRGTMRSPATTSSRRGPSTTADGVTGGRNLPPQSPFLSSTPLVRFRGGGKGDVCVSPLRVPCVPPPGCWTTLARFGRNFGHVFLTSLATTLARISATAGATSNRTLACCDHDLGHDLRPPLTRIWSHPRSRPRTLPRPRPPWKGP